MVQLSILTTLACSILLITIIKAQTDPPCDDTTSVVDGVTQNDKCWVTLEPGAGSFTAWTGLHTSDPEYYVCGFKYKIAVGDGAANLNVKYCKINDWSVNTGYIRTDEVGSHYNGLPDIEQMCSTNQFVTGMQVRFIDKTDGDLTGITEARTRCSLYDSTTKSFINHYWIESWVDGRGAWNTVYESDSRAVCGVQSIAGM